MSSSSTAQVFFYGLAILFIGLKLGHVIDWAWYLVLAPLWAPLAAVIAVIACVVLVGTAIKAWKK